MTVQTIYIADPRSPNPVNSLGSATRVHLSRTFRRALSDPTVTSIILTGGGGKDGSNDDGPTVGSNFSAGADIREFAGPEPKIDPTETVPSLGELCALIESSTKPVVAAIRGACLGGGLELALACHYRVTPSPTSTDGSKTRLGLPEVNLGLIPGAGGTQRLPRLCGLRWSLTAIVSGRMVGIGEAVKVGLIDGVCGHGRRGGMDGMHVPKDESLIDCAGRWAEYAEIMPTVGRMTSRRSVRGAASDGGVEELVKVCDMTASKLPKASRGGEAVQTAVKSIRASFESPNFESGMDVEAGLFMDLLVNSVQGRARRHAFFAERAAPQAGGGKSGPRGIGATAAVAEMVSDPTKVSVGIIGAGTMGSGIALTFLRAGYSPVTLVDNSAAGLDRGVRLIKKILAGDVAKERVSVRRAQRMGDALKPSTDLGSLQDCAIVVEAAFENLAIKRGIFEKLDGIVRPDAYLCSNTSTLSIDSIASALSPHRRDRCAGMHFFSPAHVMKLVEIVRGSETSPETLRVISAVTKKVRKVGVTVGNCDGFVGNRMLHPYTSEMLFVAEAGGVSVPEIDGALTKFGMAVGPFVMSDIAGNDIGLNIRREKGVAKDPETGLPGPNRVEGMRYTDLGDDLVTKLGRVGQKAGKGWYTYDPRIGKGRAPLPSSEVAAFISTYTDACTSPDKGRRLKKEEIIERLLYPLVNEGFKILEEGIARDPADIDVIYLYGYGWPVWRGGPMFWADNEVGLPQLLGRLKDFHKRYPGSDYYAPSQLLRKCVAMDVGVQEYYRKGHHKSGTSSLSKL